MSKVFFIAFIWSLGVTVPVAADSSGPPLAAYYDRFLALCGDSVFEWNDSDAPEKRMSGIRQVGVGKNNSYALTEDGELLAWSDNPDNSIVLTDEVKSFYAGRSGLFAIRDDSTLVQFNTNNLLGFGEDIAGEPREIATNILTASVGDSANYYVTRERELFVYGRAHRGQYGDGKLAASENYVQTANNVIQVVSHTGHALILKWDGTVWGTGGNIYGPLGRHGFGDKAIEWGFIIGEVNLIATGSSHSLAIKRDGSLWVWGRHEGLDPKQVMRTASAVAAGSSSTIALSNGTLWQWSTGSRPRAIMKCENL
ncbi:MAG: alpha-tubulin suppressor-like RCC1 family protein [Parasphingorhabdus sp.]|jgi:alpha-tubulin suppressor-like RCC1 family protein